MDDTERLTWLEDQLWNDWRVDHDGADYVLWPPRGDDPFTGDSLREVIDAAAEATS